MIHVRSPRRELGIQDSEKLFIILPHFGWACLSVKLRNSGQKAPYFYHLRAKKVPLDHNNKSPPRNLGGFSFARLHAA
jgi:hypothetical protein